MLVTIIRLVKEIHRYVIFRIGELMLRYSLREKLKS